VSDKPEQRPGSEYIRRQTEAARRDWEQTRATGVAPVNPTATLARGRADAVALGFRWLIRTWPGRTVLVAYVVGLGLVFASRAFSDGARDTVQSIGGTLVALGIVIAVVCLALFTFHSIVAALREVAGEMADAQAGRSSRVASGTGWNLAIVSAGLILLLAGLGVGLANRWAQAGLKLGGIALALGGLALLLACSARAGAPRRQVYEGGAIAALLLLVVVGLIAR
jgi:hypothetical protein